MNTSCKICSSETREIHQQTFGVYHVCDHCGFISKDKCDQISEQDQLTIYNSHQNSIDDPVYVEYFDRFLNESVFPYMGNEKKGLDFGSGPSPVLAQLLSDTYGYDMDIYDLFYSPQKSYLNKTYDLITVTEVVEHLENPLDYFALFREHLNENGVLAIMTHFHNNNDEDFLHWHYIRDRSHISFYNYRTFEVIAEKLHLKILTTDHKKFITFEKSVKLSEIKISAPAHRALVNENITSIEQLSQYTEKQLLQLHGFGPKAIRILKEKGIQLKQETE